MTTGKISEGECIRSRFSEQNYAADFGRYEGVRAAEHPAHELLVGRKGQRAYFLNLLLTVGRKGAYLVTGHRGSGKTAFVKFCVDEYRENVFRRYLKSNVGRRLFWDRLGHLAFGVLLILAFLLASELLQELASLKRWSFLDGLIAFFLGLFCCYPLLIAYETLELALEGRGDKPRPARGFLRSRPNPVALFIFWVGALVAWWIGPWGVPALAISQLTLLVGWVYLVTISISFNAWEKTDDPGCDDLSFVPARSPRKKNLLGRLLVLVVILSMPIWPPVGWWQATISEQSITVIIVRNWVLGLVLIACGTLQRGIDQFFLWQELLGREHEESKHAYTLWGEIWGKNTGESVLRNSLKASMVWQVVGAFVLGAAIYLMTTLSQKKILVGDQFEIILAIAAFFLLLLGWIWRFHDYYHRPHEDGYGERLPFSLHPRPRVLVGIKAFIFFVVGLQLAYPLALAMHPLLSRIPTHYIPVPSVSGSLAQELSRNAPLFATRESELFWLAGCSLLLLMIVFLEYEWIIRPYAQVRDDVALHGPKRPAPRRVRADYQRLAEQTIFWKTFQAWLPVLVVPVNLGFDQLELRLVIEAMLAGLKDAYQRAFLHWNSAFVVVQRFLGFGVLLLLAIAAAQATFNVDLPQPKQGSTSIGKSPAIQATNTLQLQREPDLCQIVSKGSANWFLCRIGGEPLIRFIHWAPFQGSDNDNADAIHKSLWLYQLVRVGGVPQLRSLKVYHLLAFALFYLAWIRVRRNLPVTPYHQIYQRISLQLDSLSSRLRQESRPDRSKITEWLGAIIGRERVEAVEFEPFDPRMVEISLLQILADSQNVAIHTPFATRHRISPPVPEVIFVFDELDKIGVDAVSSREPRDSEAGEREPLDIERERSRALFRLFADLKNILSSGVARFIFIGGRNLHDEWLADQSARRPLLTNIFDAEIYIPSLLADESVRQHGDTLLGGVRLLVSEHLRRARHLHTVWQSKIMGPWLRLWVEERRPVTFVQGLQEESDHEPPLELKFYQCDSGKEWKGSEEFYSAFIEFLGYRSRGNPKKMIEILESFLRPVGRVVTNQQIRRDKFDCDHVLLFHDRDRFRVQLVANIFRQIGPIIQDRLYGGDDKLGPGILYLADFLLKFHRRAFTWSNLERVDELVHIHRAPDLRPVLEALVLNWSERYLHLINNGMYDYRFESDFARELDYLSRHSEPEMAAFNFTLDESQSLKLTYRARLGQLEKKQALDLTMGLGELHEFDEEYETARYYYQQALRALDEEFRFQVGDRDNKPVSFDLLQQGAEGFQAVRRIAIWGVARVRIMLQIGMTYERSRDLERAHVEYRDARTLASAIIRALLGWKDGVDAVPGQDWSRRFGGGVGGENLEEGGFLWILKNLNILLHPIFAEAWLNEKSVAGVDTGPSLLERELWGLRSILPFVSAEEFPHVDVAKDAVQVQHSNFSLTFAELHNKAGSLYFFKGRQLVPLPQAKALAGGKSDALQGTEGYLLKALSHYAVSLHELRRFNSYRLNSSAHKLNDYANDPQGTFGKGAWPEFVHRVTAGTLGNLAESLLARVSLVGLRNTETSSKILAPTNPWDAFDALYQDLKAWLEANEDSTIGMEWGRLMTALFPSCGVPTGLKTSLAEWFGSITPHTSEKESKGRLLQFSKPHSDVERLATSIVFSLAAAKVLEEDGYFEGAAAENLKIVRTVAHYIWCWNLLNRLGGVSTNGEAAEWQSVFKSSVPGIPPLLNDLLRIAVKTVDRVQSLLLRSRRAQVTRASSTIGDLLPPTVLTLSCSLALGYLALDPEKAAKSNEIQELRELLQNWTGKAGWAGAEWFRSRLMNSLDRYSFPMINRMQSLKILIDDALVRNPMRETEDHIIELLRLEEMFKSSLHFPPLQSGLTLGLAYMISQSDTRGGGEGGWTPTKLAGALLLEGSKHRLSLSQRMYTMKRTYYEAISGLYYLYDDFNDRTIHYNHAIQMAGTELSSYMLSLLGAATPRQTV